MNAFVLLIIIGIHVFTLIDALKNIRMTHGAFRVTLAFFPPVIGPIIYFLTKSSRSQTQTSRKFMKRKYRYYAHK